MFVNTTSKYVEPAPESSCRTLDRECTVGALAGRRVRVGGSGRRRGRGRLGVGLGAGEDEVAGGVVGVAGSRRSRRGRRGGARRGGRHGESGSAHFVRLTVGSSRGRFPAPVSCVPPGLAVTTRRRHYRVRRGCQNAAARFWHRHVLDSADNDVIACRQDVLPKRLGTRSILHSTTLKRSEVMKLRTRTRSPRRVARVGIAAATTLATVAALAACGVGGAGGASADADTLTVVVEGGGKAELQPIADLYKDETGTAVTLVELPYAGTLRPHLVRARQREPHLRRRRARRDLAQRLRRWRRAARRPLHRRGEGRPLRRPRRRGAGERRVRRHAGVDELRDPLLPHRPLRGPGEPGRLRGEVRLSAGPAHRLGAVPRRRRVLHPRHRRRRPGSTSTARTSRAPSRPSGWPPCRRPARSTWCSTPRRVR